MYTTKIFRNSGRFNAETGTHDLEVFDARFNGRTFGAEQMKFLVDTLRHVRGQCKHEGVPFSWDRFNAATGSAENAAGFQQVIDTLTYLSKDVVGEVKYEFPIADFVPTAVGNGAWSNDILTPQSFRISSLIDVSLSPAIPV